MALAGCASIARTGSPPTSEVLAILAAASDTVLATMRVDQTLYAADTATAEALATGARRLRRSVATAPGPAWCEDRAGTGRTVGTTIKVAVDSLAGERATVRWSATCLMTPRGDSAPAMFGEGGIYEVMRRAGHWRATRSLARFDF